MSRVHAAATNTHTDARSARREQEAVCLLDLRLSSHHWRLLLELYAHPLLSRSELSTLLDLTPRTVERTLTDLRGRWDGVEERMTGSGERLVLRPRG